MSKFGGWPSRIGSAADLPARIAAVLLRHAGNQPIGDILHIEPDNQAGRAGGEWRMTAHAQVLAVTPRTMIAVHDTHADTPDCVAVPFADLDAWSLHLELLFGAMEFLAGGNRDQRLRVVFNTVGWNEVHETLSAIERRTLGHTERIQNTIQENAPESTRNRRTFPKLPHKFRYYLKSALLPGEQVRALFYQPGFLHRRGRWQCVSMQPWALAKTCARLLVVHEPPSEGAARYGMCIFCVPLRSRNALRLEDGKKWTVLTHTEYPDLLTVPVVSENVTALAQLVVGEQALPELPSRLRFAAAWSASP